MHPIKDDADLAQRLGPCRRVFGLVHQNAPDLALAFVHVALLDGLPFALKKILKIDPDLSVEEEHKKECACFYTISSPYKGLSGIDLGHSLISNAMQYFKLNMARIGKFCTLSPMPLLVEWTRNNREIKKTAQLKNRNFLKSLSADYLMAKNSYGRAYDPVGKYL